MSELELFLRKYGVFTPAADVYLVGKYPRMHFRNGGWAIIQPQKGDYPAADISLMAEFEYFGGECVTPVAFDYMSDRAAERV